MIVRMRSHCRDETAANKVHVTFLRRRLLEAPANNISMASGSDSVNQSELLNRFKALMLKRGIGIGSLMNGSADEFNLVMAAASLTLRGQSQNEFRVNDSLKQWLGGAGQCIETDHVELRRWLVDSGLWVRDGFGREYTMAVPVPERFSAVVAALEGVDQSALATSTRSEHSEKRAARKAAWQSQVAQE